VELADGTSTESADGVVLALPVAPLREVVAHSPGLADPDWRASIASLRTTSPFVVWRLWLDRPTDPARAPFVGTTGVGSLDNISLFHLLEDESRAWQQRTGGSVVELHAYAVDPGRDEASLRADLLGGLHQFYPELREATILEERYLVRSDCPAFECGSHAARPGVATPWRGLTVAGDLVKLPFPSALMERAAASGVLAANHLLAEAGVRPEPIRAIHGRGMLASVYTPSLASHA
jgi:isorenieratene synthase